MTPQQEGNLASRSLGKRTRSAGSPVGSKLEDRVVSSSQQQSTSVKLAKLDNGSSTLDVSSAKGATLIRVSADAAGLESGSGESKGKANVNIKKMLGSPNGLYSRESSRQSSSIDRRFRHLGPAALVLSPGALPRSGSQSSRSSWEGAPTGLASVGAEKLELDIPSSTMSQSSPAW